MLVFRYSLYFLFFFFFFNDTATTEIYTLSLHDALPIFGEFRCGCDLDGPHRFPAHGGCRAFPWPVSRGVAGGGGTWRDRKSTRLNSSHPSISYAVFCLKKKNKKSIGSCECCTATSYTSL